MGISKWMTTYELWLEKNGLFEKEDNMSMKYGRDNEEMILSMVNERLKSDLKPTVIESTLFPFMGASLDGLSSCGKLACEIKCANKEDHDLAKNGIVPKHYYPQIQKQLLCLGIEFMYYVSFHQGDFVMLTVKFDRDYQAKMVELEKEFYQCMINFTPPEMSDKDYQFNEDERLKEHIENIFYCREMIKKYKKSEEDSRDRIISICDNRSTICGKTKITKTICKGQIDYQLASDVEFKNIDLEKYRKPSYEKWRIG
jgi:putative phage-type endonuclease